jgi:transposase-like protein
MNQSTRMQSLVKAYHTSGMGLTKFAASKGVDFYQLRYWVRKLNKEKGASPAFIQLSPSLSSPSNLLVEISYPSGVQVKLTTNDTSFIGQLISL